LSPSINWCSLFSGNREHPHYRG